MLRNLIKKVLTEATTRIPETVFKYLSANFDPSGGDCYQIALALHKVFGGTLVAVIRDDEPEYLHHCAVQLPNGSVIDGTGYTSFKKLKQEFSGYDEQTERDEQAMVIPVDEWTVERMIGRANDREDKRGELIPAIRKLSERV